MAEKLYSPNSYDYERLLNEGRNNSIALEKDLRRQLGVRKSLQVLEEISSPGLHAASPLIREAGTPSPFLGISRSDNSSISDKLIISDGIERKAQLFQSSFASPKRGNSSFSHQSFLDITAQEKVESTSNFSILLEQDPAMEGAGELFEEFMQLYGKHPHSTDIFELVEDYEIACRNKIKSLLQLINKTDPSRRRMKNTLSLLNKLYRECYTWRLLGSLFRDRILSEKVIEEVDLETLPPVDSSRSEKIIVSRLFEAEAATRQCQIIVDWLERNMQDKLEDLLASENLQFQSNSLYWEHTVHNLNQIRMGSKDPSLASNLVTEIDPDAPIRQQRALSSLDHQDEEQLLLYMFRFIRAGKLEEAQSLCSDQGHFWRAATLDGWRLWHDPNYFIDGEDEIFPVEGNPDRDLWKINCWSLAEEKGCSIYEKAMYGALSGHLKQLLPACSSWEDCLWAYFKVLVDVRVEQEIRNQPRMSEEFLDLPADYWKQAQDYSLTPRGIIENLKSHQNPSIRKQCEDVYRIFQANIILNEIDELLMEMKSVVSANTADPHLLRCMTHIVLFLQAVGIQTNEEVCVEVLIKYVEILIETNQKKLIAIYTSRLPPDMQVHVYAKFLEEIKEKEERELYLGLAEEAALDLKLITKQVVENIRNKEYESENITSSELDNLKINAIDWLIFDPSQRIEAIKQANAITRGFLANKKHDSAQSVFDKLPSDSIDVAHKQWRRRAGEKVLPPEDDDAIREYLSIKMYLFAHDAFNVWFSHYHHQAPLEPQSSPGATFKEQILYEESLKEYETAYDRWQKTLETHVKTTSNCIYNVFMFPGGWLVDEREHKKEPDENRLQQLTLLRRLCIPYLAFLLHTVLHSSKQYRSVLHLAEIIQSKQYRLYEAFEKHELQRFLLLIRDSCIGLLDEGYDAFGFDKSTK